MKKCKIAFLLNGGLGSLLIGTEYVKKFYDAFSTNNNLELFAYLSPSQAVSDCIMKGASFVKEYYTHKGFNDEMKKKYDIVIEVVFFPYIHHIRNSLHLSEQLKSYLNKTISFQKSDEMCRLFSLKGNVKPNIYEWGMLNNCNRFNIADPLKLLNITDEYSYTPTICKNTNDVLANFDLQSNRYITIQRGTNSGFSKETVRDWPLSHYEELVTLLKEKYPDYQFVQLGESFENCTEIKGVDICLLEKTDLEDIKVLLANSFLHIDGECGMVHLRKSLKGGPSVVFMGAAPSGFFGYEGNINIEKHPCGCYCHGLSNIWYKKCIKYNNPRCMTEITPEYVVKQIDEYFPSNKTPNNTKQTKLEEILSNESIYLDEEWVSNWLSKQEIYEYYLEEIKVKDLYVNILTDNGWEKTNIVKSPAYKFLSGDATIYKKYIEYKNTRTPDKIIHSVNRYKKLISELDKNYLDSKLIVVNGENIIMDGQHRACWLRHKSGPNHTIKVLKIYGNFGI